MYVRDFKNSLKILFNTFCSNECNFKGPIKLLWFIINKIQSHSFKIFEMFLKREAHKINSPFKSNK